MGNRQSDHAGALPSTQMGRGGSTTCAAPKNSAFIYAPMGRRRRASASVVRSRRRADLLGVGHRPVLLPSLPPSGGITLDRRLVGDLTLAYLDLGPDEMKSRSVGVFRYLMNRLEAGFEDTRLPRRETRERVVQLSSGAPTTIVLEDAEWRSVYRAVQNAGGRGEVMSTDRAQEITHELFSVGHEDLDVDVLCSRCGATTASQDAAIVDGRWVGEVCCLGRPRMVPASSFPGDAENFSGGR